MIQSVKVTELSSFFFPHETKLENLPVIASASPVRLASRHYHLVLCLLKKNLKIILPVEFTLKNL